MVTTEQAESWLRLWQEQLAIQAWEISCVWVEAETIEHREGDPNREYYGSMAADPVTWTGVLTLALDREPAEVELTILHECLHLLLSEWAPTVDSAKSYVPAALYVHLTQQREDAEERAVNLLERAIWKSRTTT